MCKVWPGSERVDARSPTGLVIPSDRGNFGRVEGRLEFDLADLSDRQWSQVVERPRSEDGDLLAVSFLFFAGDDCEARGRDGLSA